jgi:hypothetical protein
MDSSAYRYFIIELQQQADNSFVHLPLHFVKSGVGLNQDSFSSLQLFLQSVICAGGSGNAALLPAMLAEPRDFFANLFVEAQRALLDVVCGADPSSHPFRHNGAVLARFLSYCENDGDAAITALTDTSGRAMLCFLLEGLMHAGWCPNAFEGTAKRSAHSYFVSLKKTLHFMQPGQNAIVLGYLWGAWLLAQKTEGIRDEALRAFSAAETFEWNIGNTCHTYCARKSGNPPVIYLIHKSPHDIPHPVSRISCRGKTGLSLYADNEPVIPEALLETSEIVRPKINGNKYVYQCRTAALTELRWTVVFLFPQTTVYRIDILKLFPGTGPAAIRAEMRLENEVRLEEIKKGHFTGKGPENSVIRFIQDPLSFRLGSQDKTGISVFFSGQAVIPENGSLQVVCAWARGKGITALHELKLLGIFE